MGSGRACTLELEDQLLAPASVLLQAPRPGAVDRAPAIVCTDVTQRKCEINSRAYLVDVSAVEPRQLGPRSTQSATPSMALTGWGRLLTTWVPIATSHAVDPQQPNRCLALCGAELVTVDLNRPWSGQDAADSYACRSCTELVD
jgi:hypothetical protein